MSAPNIDWGYSVNLLMEAARLSVAKAEADPCKLELGELIKAKLLAAEEGHKIGDAKGIHIFQERRDEARALIAGLIEQQLTAISESDEHLPRLILETVLAVEDLEVKDAVKDKFRHQLELEATCRALAAAVIFLLCDRLAKRTPKGAAHD